VQRGNLVEGIMRISDIGVPVVIIVIVIQFSAAILFSGALMAGGERGREAAAMSGKEGGPISPMSVKTEGIYQAGYRVLEITTTDAKGEKASVGVAVWYPSAQKEEPFQYIYGENKIETNVALNGKPASGEFPLILYSHGAMGCGLSMAFLTEKLAREGFIVAAPDYPDQYCVCRILDTLPKQNLRYKVRMLKWVKALNVEMLRRGKAYRPNLAYRPRLAKITIDRLLAENRASESPFNGSINENKIGMVGHSFGAWTSMLLGGADPDYKDSRVKAIVCFSGPVHEGVYQRSEVASIHIPVMFMYGEDEERFRGDDKMVLYEPANSPKFLLEIKGADHLTFSGGIREEFSKMSDYTRKDPQRAAIVEYTIAFLQYYLKEDKEAKKQLEVASDEVISYVKDFSSPDSKP
jgi:dienelactone hydrolase